MRQDQVTHIYNRIIKISQHMSRIKVIINEYEFIITIMTESLIQRNRKIRYGTLSEAGRHRDVDWETTA